MLRSTEVGTYCVHHCLNCVRAITLCCTANTDISSKLTISASAIGATNPESMNFPVGRPPCGSGEKLRRFKKWWPNLREVSCAGRRRSEDFRTRQNPPIPRGSIRCSTLSRRMT